MENLTENGKKNILKRWKSSKINKLIIEKRNAKSFTFFGHPFINIISNMVILNIRMHEWMNCMKQHHIEYTFKQSEFIWDGDSSNKKCFMNLRLLPGSDKAVFCAFYDAVEYGANSSFAYLNQMSTFLITFLHRYEF